MKRSKRSTLTHPDKIYHPNPDYYSLWTEPKKWLSNYCTLEGPSGACHLTSAEKTGYTLLLPPTPRSAAWQRPSKGFIGPQLPHPAQPRLVGILTCSGPHRSPASGPRPPSCFWIHASAIHAQPSHGLNWGEGGKEKKKEWRMKTKRHGGSLSGSRSLRGANCLQYSVGLSLRNRPPTLWCPLTTDGVPVCFFFVVLASVSRPRQSGAIKKAPKCLLVLVCAHLGRQGGTEG